MEPTTRSLGLAVLALSVAAGVALFSRPGEAADPMNHYPFDPVCPWGRLANGRGVIVRCLSQAEAVELGRRAAAPPQTASTPVPVPVPEAGIADAMPTFTQAEFRNLKVAADLGKLPEADKKLSAAKDRYLDCIAKGGGLSEQKAEVQVRFLVRARGRAEGVSVVKRQGMSAQAAQCIAEVVDRRAVGVPDEPIVGATAVLQFSAR